MIKFPDEFVATQYPGYFWNVNNRRLYTIKVSGVLQPLRQYSANRWQNQPGEHYRISHQGKRQILLVANLARLRIQDQTVPVLKK